MNTTITIHSWIGRAGNNIFQVLNTIAYCQKYHHRFCVGDRPPLIKSFSLDFSSGKSTGSRSVQLFYLDKECPELIVTTDDRRKIAREYLSDKINCSIPKIDEGTLVVHLRSGDIMGPRPHGEYVQPPLAFYRRIIKDHSFQKILIVTEIDRRNPVIAALVREFDAEVLCRNAQEDFGVLLGAVHFCPAFSSFSLTAALLAPMVKHIYIPSFPYNTFDNHNCLAKFCNFTRYKINDYIQRGKWNANLEQLNQMIAFPDDQVALD